jgi:phosphopantothenoylcysteine decarboxylase / phosphopantothenate---cysteine ligase
MARILITSGPTRQYLDPVRYLTNGSSGRMGAALALAVLEAGHEAVVVSGPVEVDYPLGAEVVSVVTTEEMLEAARDLFPPCDGLLGVAAPCDYCPVVFQPNKMAKTGSVQSLELTETPDILATIGAMKADRQWMVSFALETEDGRARALKKLHRKNADWIVLNGPEVICESSTQVEVLDRSGTVLAELSGTKREVARSLFELIEANLARPILDGVGQR